MAQAVQYPDVKCETCSTADQLSNQGCLFNKKEDNFLNCVCLHDVFGRLAVIARFMNFWRGSM